MPRVVENAAHCIFIILHLQRHVELKFTDESHVALRRTPFKEIYGGPFRERAGKCFSHYTAYMLA